MNRFAALIISIAGLTGCATQPTPVVKPTGPFATVVESAVGGGVGGGTFFFVAELDDQVLRDNVMRASLSASAGRGADLRLRGYERYVPAGKHKMKLSARFAYAAPIQSLFQSGGQEPLEAIVDVDLIDGGHYRVTGMLDAFRRELWLEDSATGLVVGKKTVKLANSEAEIKAMQGASYTCCNLRYEGNWISDANWSTLPMIPAGSRIKVLEYGGNRAEVLIEGRPMRLGLDYGREKQTVQQFVERLLLREDPAPVLAAWPEAVRNAVKKGQVGLGMTKPQVVASLGPPRLDVTPSQEATKWTYWTIAEQPIVLEWDAQGRLSGVQAEESVKALVMHRE